MSASLNWGRCATRAVLMIPGPTELPYPVIQAMNQPPAIQYDRAFDEDGAGADHARAARACSRPATR